MPPRNLWELLINVKLRTKDRGVYLPQTYVIQEEMVVTSLVSDTQQLGVFIHRLCDGKDTFHLKRRITRRRIFRREVQSCRSVRHFENTFVVETLIFLEPQPIRNGGKISLLICAITLTCCWRLSDVTDHKLQFLRNFLIPFLIVTRSRRKSVALPGLSIIPKTPLTSSRGHQRVGMGENAGFRLSRERPLVSDQRAEWSSQ
ncbi:hypothetical protein MHYP_G00241110 [Metynnis hypsauchen]